MSGVTLYVDRTAPSRLRGSHRAGAGSAGRRWIRADPVRAAAMAMITFAILWRADVALGGYLAQDDWVLASYATGASLSPRYLLTLFNDHLMPAGMLLDWGLVRVA